MLHRLCIYVLLLFVFYHPAVNRLQRYNFILVYARKERFFHFFTIQWREYCICQYIFISLHWIFDGERVQTECAPESLFPR